MNFATTRTVLALVGLQGLLSVVYATLAADVIVPDMANRGMLGRSAMVAVGVAWPFSGPAALLLLPGGAYIYGLCLAVLLALFLGVPLAKRVQVRNVFLGAGLAWWLMTGVLACGAAST